MVVLDWRKKFKIEEIFICVFLEMYGIPYMKKVPELYDTEFGGIRREF